MRPRVIMAVAVAVILLGGGFVPAADARLTDTTTEPAARSDVTAVAADTTAATATAAPAPVTAPPPPTLASAQVSVQGMDDFFSWTLLDRDSGEISGAENMAATSTTQSMIKIWIAADYFRRLGDSAPSAARKKQASIAIRDSDDRATESLFNAGGRAAVLDRMIKTCGLTDTRKKTPPGRRTVWWSYTQMSARDAVRLGECVKSGRAAGPKWTNWILTEMTEVRGTTAKKDQHRTWSGGRWGIIEGLPEEIRAKGPVAIKNGWTLIAAVGRWHLNCLAVTDDWVLAVMMRYQGKRGLDHGADACASVATQLTPARPGAALKIPVPLVQS